MKKAKTKPPDKCKVKFCRRNRDKNRTVCSRHKHEADRERDPVRYSYGINRRNARRRGKPFTISLEYFREFCYQYNYIAGKGRHREGLTVDCIDPDLGYIPGNIRCITNSENARKGVKKLCYNYITGEAIVL